MKPLGTTDPASVGSYRILSVLGGGGMGRVFLGESRSGRRVAIKVIRPELAEDPTFRRRFAREVAAIRTVNPLFTAAVVEADTDAAAPWVATTYIEGPTLGELVGQGGPMAGGAVLTLAAGLADAVTSIHRVGLVHRDIKPSNVIINDLGPHVIDFGIALTLDSTNMTSVLLGTPSYIAPEIIQGGDPSAASDVFSLGSTLVFASSGRHLVSEGTMHAQILRMTMGRFDLAAVPKELRPLIVRCLSPRSRDRPTADELARIVIASGVATPAPGWYARPDAAQPVVVPPLPVTLAGQHTVSRRTLLIGGGVLGAAALGAALGIGAALTRRPDYQAVLQQVPVPPATTPPPARVPGMILWQARSGVDPVAATQAGQTNAPRIVVLGTTLISANAGEIVAVDEGGAGAWVHPLPSGVVALRPWGDSVLVTDTRTAWLVAGAGGTQSFSVAVADLELVKAKADGQRQSAPEIGGVAIGTDRAYLGLGTALIALDRSGAQLWRQPRTGQAPVGSPVGATADWVVTHDVLPAPSGGAGSGAGGSTAQVQLVVRAAKTGARKWAQIYTPTPFQPPNGPPGGNAPAGGPPPGAGAGPGYDDAWEMVECVIGSTHVVVRDSQEVRAFNLATGSPAWVHAAPTPVTSMVLAGDLVLVGGAQITAYSVASGLRRWEVNRPGARMTAALDGHSVIIATPQGITALDLSSRPLWRTPLPRSITDAALDRVTVSPHEAYLTVKGRGGRAVRFGMDVIAIALD